MVEKRLLERSHYNADVASLSVGSNVTVAGWVRKRRNLGSLIFVDLYDRTGILQVVFDPERNPELMQAASELTRETSLTVQGKVGSRPPEALNPDMITGKIELIAESFTIHSTSKLPPIQMTGGPESNEELRLKYRYLDLRRPEMFKILNTRHQLYQVVRSFYVKNGFIEVTTPHLLRSTPEGARDFLVPSRLHPGSCYALPQSPQMLKQILMIAGFDRYFQIAKCFRDEDSRADRQPEFSQIDVEMSFTSTETLFELHECLMAEIFKKFHNIDVPSPFNRITWDTAIDLYGSDKPDLRFNLEIVDITSIVKGSGIEFIDTAIDKGGVVRLVRYPGGSKLSQKQIQELENLAKQRGLKGMMAVKISSNGTIRGGIFGKSLSEEKQRAVLTHAKAGEDDILCVIAGDRLRVAAALGDIRLEIAERENLRSDAFEFVWVTDFPLLVYDDEEQRFFSEHHPFTAPKLEDLELLDIRPEKCRAQAYDLVLNGIELGGGSVRIHQSELQKKMFSLLGITEKSAQEQFGFLLEALNYGTPPHCGIAFGLDRLVMILVGTNNLRDVIAFPKSLQAVCLMSQAPSAVTPEQLEIVGLQLKSDLKDRK
ncbi:MAG: aspartate--tRNA ligase [bacterium]